MMENFVRSFRPLLWDQLVYTIHCDVNISIPEKIIYLPVQVTLWIFQRLTIWSFKNENLAFVNCILEKLLVHQPKIALEQIEFAGGIEVGWHVQIGESPSFRKSRITLASPKISKPNSSTIGILSTCSRQLLDYFLRKSEYWLSRIVGYLLGCCCGIVGNIPCHIAGNRDLICAISICTCCFSCCCCWRNCLPSENTTSNRQCDMCRAFRRYILSRKRFFNCACIWMLDNGKRHVQIAARDVISG